VRVWGRYDARVRSAVEERALPERFEWPTRRMVRADRAFGIALAIVAIVPLALCAAWVVRASGDDRAASLVLLCVTGSWFVLLSWVVVALVDRRGRGLVLRAIRGGDEPAIEVRARSGVGGGLVLPLDGAEARDRTQRLGAGRTLAWREAIARTAIGEVLFARGGARLDPELVAWLASLAAARGSAVPSPDAPSIDAIVLAAQGAPLDPPPGIRVATASGQTRWSYRSVEPRGLLLALCLLAALALWTFVLPRAGVSSTAALARFTVPAALAIAYRWLLAGPVTVEVRARGATLDYRVRRFEITLWRESAAIDEVGLDLVALPFAALRIGGRTRGFASPEAGGPDAAGLAWLVAALRSTRTRGQ